MSFAIESVSSINSTPTGVSIVKDCNRVRWIGQGIEFKVYQGKNISHVNANLINIPNVVTPVATPPVVESSTISDGFLSIRGRVRPNASIRITNRSGLARTIMADSSGQFNFQIFNPTGGVYKIESDGGTSYAAVTNGSTQPSGMQYSIYHHTDPRTGVQYMDVEGQTYLPDWAVCDNTGTITTLTELANIGSDVLLGTYTGNDTRFKFTNVTYKNNFQYELVQVTCSGGYRYTERFTV